MKKNLIFVLIVVTVLASCANQPEVDIPATQTFEASLQTAVAATVQAELIAAEPTDVPEDVQPPEEAATATPEPLPTFTIAPPTLAPTSPPAQPTANPTDAPPPCYRAEMISETIPDGTKFIPGTVFTKIWVIRNTGVCEWTEDFTWTLVQGEDFGQPVELPLNRSVQPGEDLEVKLDMQTPKLEGAYRGDYQIFTDEGVSITPLGFWLYIVSEK